MTLLAAGRGLGGFNAVEMVRHEPVAVAPAIARRAGGAPETVMRQSTGLRFLDVGQGRNELLGSAPPPAGPIDARPMEGV